MSKRASVQPTGSALKTVEEISVIGRRSSSMQLSKEVVDRFNQDDYYKPPNEEDYYIPPGRKPYDREELNPSEDDIQLGPKTTSNNQLYRQKFAIEDYMKTLKVQIQMNDVTSQIGPHQTVKPAIKESFFIKEQRWADSDFIEPDDEALKYREAGKHVEDYLTMMKKHPHFVENRDSTSIAINKQINEKIPLPFYARMKLNMSRKIIEQMKNTEEQKKDEKLSWFKETTKFKPKKLKINKQAKYKNDPQVKSKINHDQPVFKRDVHKKGANDAHAHLQKKLIQSDFNLRLIKNGHTIFAQDSMKQKYSNPYFKNKDMHNQLLNYLDQRRPKLSPNPNINAYESDRVPFPEKIARTNASWLNSPSSAQFKSMQHSQQISPQSRSPFGAKDGSIDLLQVNSTDGLSSRNLDVAMMNQSQFKFGPQKIDVDLVEINNRSPSPTTAQFPQRSQESVNKMLGLTITQATQSHYPALVPQLVGNKTTRNYQGRNGSFATEAPFVDHLGSATLPDVNNSFMTLNNTPVNVRKKLRETDFQDSAYLSQRSVDPNHLLPPCSLTVRDKADEVQKGLKFPMSPAFVSIYKMKKDIKVTKAQDFCLKTNIPFSSEEHNYYRLQQSTQRFKEYEKSLNKCFETSRPSFFETSIKIMEDDNNPKAKAKFVTEDLEDNRLYVPNVFTQAHNKDVRAKKRRFDSENPHMVKLRNQVKTEGKDPMGNLDPNSFLGKLMAKVLIVESKQKKSKNSTSAYGRLYQTLPDSHKQSKSEIVSTFQTAEKMKRHILRELEQKLDDPTLVSPDSKQKSLTDSVENLMHSINQGERNRSHAVHQSDPNNGRTSNLEEGKKVDADLKRKALRDKKRLAKKDPIQKILKANNKSYNFRKLMNDQLMRILQRYELDKPILMRDKLDIIWDKAPKKQKDADAPTPKKLPLTAEEEFEQRIIQSKLTQSDLYFQKKEEEKVKAEAIAARNQSKKKEEDNVNQYAVKFKLGKRKVYRQQMNLKQIKVYQQLLAMLQSRKVPKISAKQLTQQAYVRPMEVEREFLDAFSIILESGYFLEEEDFMQLLELLHVQTQASDVGDRVKILEFITEASKLLQFDSEKISKILQQPWDNEAAQQSQILSQGFIFQSHNQFDQQSQQALLSKQDVARIALNQRSSLFEGNLAGSMDSALRETQQSMFMASNSQIDELGQSSMNFNYDQNSGQKINIHDSAI